MKKVLIGFLGLVVIMGFGCEKIPSDSVTETIPYEDTGSVDTTLPADWPSDAPSYPGATVTKVFGGKSVMSVTSDSVSQVTEYFRAELKRQGWEHVSTNNEAHVDKIVGGSKGDRAISITLTSIDNQTTIVVSFGSTLF